jgi:RNA polymerase sigma-70 factor (ECF subfamily)
MNLPTTQVLTHGQAAAAIAAVDDETLALQAARQPAVFGELYRRHFQRVYRYHIAHTGNQADAQDLTAQTFLAALEGLGGYHGTGSFGAWLFGIARRKMAGHFRSQARVTALELADDLADAAPPPEAQAALRLQMASVSKALRQIAPERAEAIELCLFGGLSAGEAGQVMNKSEAAVKMALMRGLKDLRARLAQGSEEG